MKSTPTKKYYDKNAFLWINNKTNSFHHEEQLTKLFSLLPKKANVIDIGCAGGILVPVFLGIGRHLSYVGIDISNSFIKVAARRYPQLHFSLGDITEKKSLPKKKFDGFVAAAVIMHASENEIDTTLDNIESIVKPGGFGFITLPTSHPSGPKADSDPRHFTLLSPAEQRQLFKKHNWTIISRGTIDGTYVEKAWQWYIVELP